MGSDVLLKRADRRRLKPGVAGTVLVALIASVLLVLGLPGGPVFAQVKKAEFPISGASSNKQNPAAGGNVVVWEDDRDGVSNIYAKNLSTGQEILVATGAGAKSKPVTNGKFVAWEEKNQNGDTDIYLKNIQDSTSQARLIAGGPGDQRKPEISGNSLVWESKNSAGKWEIYRYDLSSQAPPPQAPAITTNSDTTSDPVISGDIVVWQAKTLQSNGTVTSNIFARNLATGEEFHVSASDKYQDQPAISGNIVVWRQESVADYTIFGRDLYGKDLETGEVFEVTPDLAGTSADQVAPAISGTLVVWEDNRNGKSEVWAKDLITKSEYQVSANTEPQTSPAISGETIVWESQYQGDPNFGRYDVHGVEVEAPPLAPAGLRANGSLSGAVLRWNRNIEGDLAGYNVYRSDSPRGSFVKLNGAPLSSPSYSDGAAPKGSVSYYRVTAVDTPGNESLPARTNAAAIARSSLTLSARPAVLEYGAATTLSGKLSAEGKALSGKSVVLEQRPAGARNFSSVSKLTTGADGAFRIGGLRPKKNTLYRVRYAGERDIRGSAAGRAVRVRAKVSLSKPKPPATNANVNVTGRVTTTRNGKVTVVIRRNGKVIHRTTVRLKDYRYNSNYRLGRAGKYKVQVIVPKTNTNLGDTVARSFSRR